MSIDPEKSSDLLIPVHICTQCGDARRREEFEDRALTTGIYRCASCGKEGPLNLQVRAVNMFKDDSGTAG